MLLPCSFISVFVAEFGDKTQLVSLPWPAAIPSASFAGAMAALALVLGLA